MGKIFIIFLVILTLGCISQNNAMDEVTAKPATAKDLLTPNVSAEKVEVYHFHGTHQCYSCITVGELAEKTVNTYFKDELDSGKVVFGHINGELPENREVVAKYGVLSSSLWIGTYINGTLHKEENVKVWYKINNEQDYLSYLKGILEKRLAGDFS